MPSSVALFTPEQVALCRRYGVDPVPVLPEQKVGIARNVRTPLQPLNGLRHPLEGDTAGWYLWAGEEFSNDPDFFEPVHAKHISEWCPKALRFLALPPGWRFLFADTQEDVWYDRALLDV